MFLNFIDFIPIFVIFHVKQCGDNAVQSSTSNSMGM